MPSDFQLNSVDETSQILRENNYFSNDSLSTAIFLASQLQIPLFLEGDAGVGKTEVAKALATACDAELIRLQCYEGINISQAIYEWDYSRQLLHLRVSESVGKSGVENKANGNETNENAPNENAEKLTKELYSRDFLIERPLLKAISHTGPSVLLIDEIDRADDDFEAFLLELLSDWSITIPELGTIKAEVPPLVIITSNRTRDVHDALKRRCLYHWVEHPDIEREIEIIMLKAGPEFSNDSDTYKRLARQVAQCVAEFRKMGLYKSPSVAESITWAGALSKLGAKELTPDLVNESLGAVLKYSEDQTKIKELDMGELITEIKNR